MSHHQVHYKINRQIFRSFPFSIILYLLYTQHIADCHVTQIYPTRQECIRQNSTKYSPICVYYLNIFRIPDSENVNKSQPQLMSLKSRKNLPYWPWSFKKYAENIASYVYFMYTSITGNKITIVEWNTEQHSHLNKFYLDKILP